MAEIIFFLTIIYLDRFFDSNFDELDQIRLVFQQSQSVVNRDVRYDAVEVGGVDIGEVELGVHGPHGIGLLSRSSTSSSC